MVTLNLVIPCFNEAEVLPKTIERTLSLLKQLGQDSVIAPGSGEVFVDGGSQDDTWDLIASGHASDVRVRGIKSSRNQGYQQALLAGLMNAEGDVLISLDADLQDDLDAIARIPAEYRAGADIVDRVRSNRDSDTFFKRATAHAYYRLLRVFGAHLVSDHAGSHLMGRPAVDTLSPSSPSSPSSGIYLFLRGVIPPLALRTIRVGYVRQLRAASTRKYPFKEMTELALDGIPSFWAQPLKWYIHADAFLSFACLFGGSWAVVNICLQTAAPEWTSTVILMYFRGSVQLLLLCTVVVTLPGCTRRRGRIHVSSLNRKSKARGICHDEVVCRHTSR